MARSGACHCPIGLHGSDEGIHRREPRWVALRHRMGVARLAETRGRRHQAHALAQLDHALGIWEPRAWLRSPWQVQRRAPPTRRCGGGGRRWHSSLARCTPAAPRARISARRSLASATAGSPQTSRAAPSSSLRISPDGPARQDADGAMRPTETEAADTPAVPVTAAIGIPTATCIPSPGLMASPTGPAPACGLDVREMDVRQRPRP